jgi:hypothetical protein
VSIPHGFLIGLLHLVLPFSTHVLYSLMFIFLKAMARGDERRSKHRHNVGASSSGPSAKPKKLVKRPRPSSYQEESSPEVSPAHGGTPDETECLQVHSSEIHTNREIVNYNKEDPMNVMHLCNKPCYNSSKERGTDERFWTFPIKIGTGLCCIQNHLQWSSNNMLILNT